MLSQLLCNLSCLTGEVSKCLENGIWIGVDGHATLTGTSISQCGSQGIYVAGDASSTLLGNSLLCTRNGKCGLCVVHEGEAGVAGCDFTDNTLMSFRVEGLKSLVKHRQCKLDQKSQAVNGGHIMVDRCQG